MRALGEDAVGLTHQDLDVTDGVGVASWMRSLEPEWVINTAAYHRVDDCEVNPALALAANALGALNVARAASDVGAGVVFFSTDYVFGGEERGRDHPYEEGDTPRPLNVYGASKVAAEHLLSQTGARWIIARVASLFGVAGASGKGGNFIETILARAAAGQPLQVVDDVRMSPTYTVDAALALERLIAERAEGIFHLTNEGSTSWFGLARTALELAGVDADVEPSSTPANGSTARRPRDSSLTSARLPTRARQALRPWQDALKHYLAEKGHL